MKYLSFKNKKRKDSPAHSACRNCKTELIARYCHSCGQDSYAGCERTVGEILYNTVDTVFAWDNKIFKTLKYLIFYPGKLTKEFFNGRVIQYVYPAKMFWFITILFFAVINLGDKIDNDSSDKKSIKINIDEKASQESIVAPIQQEMKGEKVEEDAIADPPVKKKKIKTEQMIQIESKFKQDFVNYMPYVMFLLVPFFALLLFMLFYKKKKYYANHMIFALHFHSFVFLLFMVMILIDDYAPDSWENVVDYTMFFLPAIYLIIALYVAYRPSIPKLLWKIPLIMLIYGIVCGTVLVLFALALVRIAEITHKIEIL